ncbi:MAG: hypothetical protein CMF55_06540 [Legionellales bacterium]|nr:hypothetical protein [Legionellales bacterium]
MTRNKKIYVYIALSFLTMANYSLGTFFLPALPMIGSYFNAPKYDAQLAYPLILLGSSLAYLYVGAISDSCGAKKTLFLQLFFYFLSFLICFLSGSMVVFLLGVFIQGMSSYYTLIVRYCNVQLDFDVVQLLSILAFVATLFIPLNAMLSGYLAHYNWRYIFILWMIVAVICLVLIYFLPTKSNVTYKDFSFLDYFKNLKFFITNHSFNQYLIAMVTVGSVNAIFYTLSPHIFIVDFGISAKIYASYLFIPTGGLLIGYVLTPIIKKAHGEAQCIFIGEIIAFISIFSFVVIFYFIPNPMVFMGLISMFMISFPMVTTNVYIQVMGINAALAGSGLSFISVGLNLLNGGVGFTAAKQDGEQMGVLMLIILVVGFSCYHYLNSKRSSEN